MNRAISYSFITRPKNPANVCLGCVTYLLLFASSENKMFELKCPSVKILLVN